MDGGDSLVSSASKADPTRSKGSCKSHREAERSRRQRINDHLSTLRSLLPNTTKTDKASLLAEVVQHVRDLRKRAADVANRDWTNREPEPAGSSPVCSCEVIDDGGLVKATVCCEDRPGLNRELGRAVRSVRGRAVRAEITTVGGGRTRSEVVVELGGGGEEEVRALRRALKTVVENRASGSVGLAQNKRARVCSSVSEKGDYLL